MELPLTAGFVGSNRGLWFLRVLPSSVIALVVACSAPPVERTPASAVQAVESPIPIKVVIVAMFERGEDTGDRPGEFQYWVERLPLVERLPFPQGYRDLRLNREKGVLGLVTGIGTAKAAASVMALGLDERFDLSKAYWLVAGIAGVDPEDASVGSAAWAEWLVDADIAHEIDPREAPADWTTGYIPLRKSEPFELPMPENTEGAVYRLDPQLVDWAYRLTRDVELPDTDTLQEFRALYSGHPAARRSPFVLKGDQLAGSTYWHGELLNDWANDWVAYWTEGEGNFVTSGMEDTGTGQALLFSGPGWTRRCRPSVGAAHRQQLHDAVPGRHRPREPGEGEAARWQGLHGLPAGPRSGLAHRQPGRRGAGGRLGSLSRPPAVHRW